MTIYAEDLPYWKTGTSSPESWVAKACTEIGRAGGKVLAEGYYRDAEVGREGFALRFRFGDDEFNLMWPVLGVKRYTNAKAGELARKAAKVQAATMLYHEVKTAAVKVRVMGARVAFHAWLVLPDGRVASAATTPEVMMLFPAPMQPETVRAPLLLTG